MTELFLLIAFIGFVLVYMASSLPNIDITPKICKPHVWRYRDASGWVPNDGQHEDRLKHARLFCAMCGKAPSQDSGSRNGEY